MSSTLLPQNFPFNVIADEAVANNPALAAGIYYLRQGWHVTRIPHGQKGPKDKGWQNLRLTEAELADHFAGSPSNIGLLLGTTAPGVVDVDLDDPVAAELAVEFLPPTGAIFGRASNPESHYLYVVNTPPIQTEQFKNVNGGTIAELRSFGGQTVVPPSQHPSGEAVRFDKLGDPAAVEADQLRASVTLLSTAVLLIAHMPEDGRHKVALAVSAILARGGIDEERIEHFHRVVFQHIGDHEVMDRVHTARYAHDRVASAKPAYGLPVISELCGNEVASRLCQWFHLSDDGETRKPTERDRVASVAGEAELWHTPDQVAYATIERGGHLENWKVRGLRFRQWLISTVRRETAKIPSQKALDEALGVTEAEALDGPEYIAFTRVAQSDGKIYVDLCDPAWRAVEVDGTGWRRVEQAPVRFTRSNSMQPLPVPEQGDINLLREFVNLASDQDFVLYVGALVAGLFPEGPYPMLILNGEQGTSKTTMAKVHRRLVDPNSSPTRSMPRSEQDLFVAAINGWVLSFDNISTISATMADALCRIATGGGFSTRRLYSDTEETLINVERPILLNGIPLLSDRADLLDRAIILTLPVIPRDQRRTEMEFWARFDQAHPKIFGALLTAISSAIREIDNIQMSDLPRMSDFAKRMAAAEKGLGWPEGTFCKAYEASLTRTMTDVASNDPIVIAIGRLLDNGPISMTATDLLRRIDDTTDLKYRPRYGWPTRANQLSAIIRRLAVPMRNMGWEVDLDHSRNEKNAKLIVIKRSGGEEPF